MFVFVFFISKTWFYFLKHEFKQISYQEMHAFNYFPSSYGLIMGQTKLFNIGIATSLREAKLWFQTSWTPLENWSGGGVG